MSTIALICGDHPNGLGTGDWPEWVKSVEGLCWRAALVAELADGADRIVLGLHRDQYNLAEFQAQARSLGIDPLGVPVLVLDSVGSRAGFETELAGLRARTEAFAGSEPEHAKPVAPRLMSRRSFLTKPSYEYVAVPFIDPTVCTAGEGCRACVDICPHGALMWTDGAVGFDKASCLSCGRCVVGCPTEAISNPTSTKAMLSSQIEAIVAASPRPLGVVFRCETAAAEDRVPGWYEVSVPCVGMVPGTWLVATLLMGAGSVTVAPCDETGCARGGAARARQAVAFARTMIGEVGVDVERVPVAYANPPLAAAIGGVALVDPFGPFGGAETMVALAHLAGRDILVDYPDSPLGRVDIDADSCTGCTACVPVCSTGALKQGYEGDSLSLTFEAGLCTGCRQCVGRCPEIGRGAIGFQPCVDTHELGGGTRLLHQSSMLPCEVCGSPIAPEAVFGRLQELLGEGHAKTVEYVSRRCLNCRGLG